MPSSDATSGLIKWLHREPWDDAFGERLKRHLGPACDKADVPLDELGNVIGDHWTMTLWGCAFEDFLTREVEGAGNIVDDYLKRRGWNEKAPNKGNLSPRKAAKTAKGREKIASWLKFLENRIAQQDPGNAMAEYDLTWIWEELGVADLRK